MTTPVPTCDVCGAEVEPVDLLRGRPHGHRVCGDAECGALLKGLDHLPEASRAAHFAIRSAAIRARRSPAAGARERVAAARDAEAGVDRRILDQMRSTRSPGARVVPLPVPSGGATVAPLPPQRRARYRRHLERTIDEAVRASAGAIARDRDDAARRRAVASERHLAERPLLDARCRQACDLCKGACCTAGGDHAFISTVTIRRLLDADPSASADDILRTYLSHLPERSVAGACVNQTATGCSLPRAWRSDTCNAWFCPPLTALQKTWDEASPPDAVLMIRRARAAPDRVTPGDGDPVVEVVWVDVTHPPS